MTKILIDDVIDDLQTFLNEVDQKIMPNASKDAVKYEEYINRFNSLKTVCDVMGIDIDDIELDVRVRKMQLSDYKEMIEMRKKIEHMLIVAKGLKAREEREIMTGKI